MCDVSPGAIGKPPCCGRLFGHRCDDDRAAWEAVRRDMEQELLRVPGPCVCGDPWENHMVHAQYKRVEPCDVEGCLCLHYEEAMLHDRS